MSRKLKESDGDTLRYFWQEKGDLKRWCYWDDVQPELNKHFPELNFALYNYEMALAQLERILDGVADDIGYNKDGLFEVE